MPYRTEWVPRELFLKHNGVSIYHAYGDNEEDDKLTHWFSTDIDPEADDHAHEFDVRELKTWAETLGCEDEYERIKQAVLLAIESGELKQTNCEEAER